MNCPIGIYFPADCKTLEISGKMRTIQKNLSFHKILVNVLSSATYDASKRGIKVRQDRQFQEDLQECLKEFFSTHKEAVFESSTFYNFINYYCPYRKIVQYIFNLEHPIVSEETFLNQLVSDCSNYIIKVGVQCSIPEKYTIFDLFQGVLHLCKDALWTKTTDGEKRILYEQKQTDALIEDISTQLQSLLKQKETSFSRFLTDKAPKAPKEFVARKETITDILNRLDEDKNLVVVNGMGESENLPYANGFSIILKKILISLLLGLNMMAKICLNAKSHLERQALLEKKEDEIIVLHRQVEWLTQQLRLMQGQRFGASSERTKAITEQISLFNEAEALAASSAPESDLEQITYKRKKRVGKREMDFSNLPVEQIVHELSEAERVCLECGGPLHKCGQSVVWRELAYVPAQYKVVEHIQAVYSCRCCEQKNDHVLMKRSMIPPALLPRSGLVSPSLLAHILNSKYVLSLPLYRQEQGFQRLGVPISRQTMANWVIMAHQKWFAGFFQLLRRELLANSILHADETTLMVLKEPGRKARQKSYVWVYRTSGDSPRPVVLYDYQPTRAGECASNFLSGFSGMLHTDGYEAYHCKLPPEITVAGCWAHMSRKFTNTLKSLPKEVRDRSPGQAGLGFCNQLFALEEDHKKRGLSFDQRFQARLERAKPVAGPSSPRRKENTRKIPCRRVCLAQR